MLLLLWRFIYYILFNKGYHRCLLLICRIVKSPNHFIVTSLSFWCVCFKNNPISSFVLFGILHIVTCHHPESKAKTIAVQSRTLSWTQRTRKRICRPRVTKDLLYQVSPSVCSIYWDKVMLKLIRWFDSCCCCWLVMDIHCVVRVSCQFGIQSSNSNESCGVERNCCLSVTRTLWFLVSTYRDMDINNLICGVILLWNNFNSSPRHWPLVLDCVSIFHMKYRIYGIENWVLYVLFLKKS